MGWEGSARPWVDSDLGSLAKNVGEPKRRCVLIRCQSASRGEDQTPPGDAGPEGRYLRQLYFV